MHPMSLHEVGEVARRAADGGYSPRGGGPNVHRVADALGLAPADVEVLLDQARQGASPMRDFKVVLGIVALVAAFVLGMGTTKLFAGRAPEAVAASGTAVNAASVGQPAVQSVTPIVTSVPGNATERNYQASGEPSQLNGTLGTLEAKTTDGDLRRAAEAARRAATPIAQNGGAAGPTPIASTNSSAVEAATVR